jgi:RimJ/RimL family protein N-acetyltransferase
VKRPRVQHKGELGVSVLKTYWGQGVGRQICAAALTVARRVGITKMNLRVREDHPGAIALYESLGFQNEGVEIRGMQVDGTFVNNRMMGICLD